MQKHLIGVAFIPGRNNDDLNRVVVEMEMRS